MEEERNGRTCAERVLCVGAWPSTHFGRAPGLDRPPRLGSPSCAGWGRTDPPLSGSVVLTTAALDAAT